MTTLFPKCFSDFVVYVDESGDHGLKTMDNTYPMFVLAFCVFNKQQYANDITPKLQEFKFRYFGHDMVVLHEHEIRKPKGPFTILFDPEIRDRFLDTQGQSHCITNIIFEQRGKQEDNELELEFRRVCDEENPTGIPLPFSIVLANKQINYCGLQLADLVARPIGRKQLNPEQVNRAYDVLETKFLKTADDGVRGAGLETYP